LGQLLPFVSSIKVVYLNNADLQSSTAPTYTIQLVPLDQARGAKTCNSHEDP